MLETYSRTLGALLVLSVTAGAAQATNAIVDDEQSAAGAALTYFRLGDEVPSYLAVLTYSVKDYTDRSMRLLAAEYSPTAVARSRRGVTVACPGSGTLTARYSRSSHVLDIEWNACVLEIYGQQHILTGPGQVALCDDDFTPQYVTSLSVGNDHRDLVERFVIDGVPTGPETQTTRNIRLAGFITFGRATVDDNFEGEFSYSLDGVYRSVSADHSEVRMTAQNAWVSGVLTYGDLGWQEDVRFNFGTFSQLQRFTPDPNQPEQVRNSSINALGLRARNAGDYQLGTETLLVSGWANYTWPTQLGAGCLNGGLSFKTLVPLRHPPEFQSGVDSYDAGEVQINGAAARMSFSANADPSELGEMHIDLGVRDAGTFGYDGNSIYETGLPAAAQCFP